MMMREIYLFTYNAVCIIGWSTILYYWVLNLIKAEKLDGLSLWKDIEVVLKSTQTLALLEVLHAITGIVRSPVVSTLAQVSTRMFCLWGVSHFFVEARSHWSFELMIFSWALVEVPRYMFYAYNCIPGKQVPASLFWLRYHLFMPLYPLGCLGEITTFYQTLPLLMASPETYSLSLPLTESYLPFYKLMIAMIIIYLMGLPVMYSHMLTQRNRAYAKLTKAE